MSVLPRVIQTLPAPVATRKTGCGVSWSTLPSLIGA
jgi:hypothetical protein